MLTAFVLFLLLPATLPVLFPGLRTDEKCLAMTRERILTQHYAATRRDVEERQREVENWHGTTSPPPLLHIGQAVSRPFAVAPRAIYWAEGIREANGVRRGEGLFYPEMFLLGQFFDLTRNPNALNETIRYTCKILLPFLVLIVVSLLTQPDNSEDVRRFFIRMRTKVQRNREADAAAVQYAYANPASTDNALLLPNSQFEFFKWDKEDTIGFGAGCLIAFAVIGVLFFILRIGA
jgi:solute:Na+ symporter, SSS family